MFSSLPVSTVRFTFSFASIDLNTWEPFQTFFFQHAHKLESGVYVFIELLLLLLKKRSTDCYFPITTLVMFHRKKKQLLEFSTTQIAPELLVHVIEGEMLKSALTVSL